MANIDKTKYTYNKQIKDRWEIEVDEHNSSLNAKRVDVVGGHISIDAGDIEIGAVEIKDADNDTRANVITLGNKNAIIVQRLIEQVKTSVNSFGSALISPEATITLTTYTVPQGQSFTFTGAIIGGDAAGEFYFEVGGNTIALVRNSGAQRTVVIKFPEPMTMGAGTEINIKAKNIDSKTRAFEATLSGYNIPI